MSDEAITALGSKYFAKASNGENGGYPVLTFASLSADKTKLKAELDKVPTSGYYTEDDRYNGVDTSKNGFWADMKEFVKGAQEVYENESAGQAEVDLETAKLKNGLQAYVGKLISTSNANTTLLHEAIEAATITEKDDYTPRSWAAYSEAKDAATALMDTMFADGKPTQANNASANDTINAAAKRLRDAQAALDLRVSKYGKDGETRVKLMASALEELNRRFSAPDALNGYTSESVAALQSALKTANETLAETPVYSAIGQLESSRLTNAVRAARAAAAGLETQSQEQIHVKLSALDAYDVYMGRTDMWWALHNKNILTAELELPANTSAASVLREKNLLKRTLNESKYDPSLLVFLNGELLNTTSMFTYNDIGVSDGVFESLKLHDGDELTLVWICGKQIMYSSTAGYYTQYLYEIPEYFRYSTIEAPAEVVAGEAFEVTVTSDAALPFLATGEKTPVVGATIRRSATEADVETVSTRYVHRNTYQTTDENGKATLTLYNEGYVLINAFRTEDEEGRYIVGPSVLVHVLPTNDLESVKLQLRKELDEVYYSNERPGYDLSEMFQIRDYVPGDSQRQIHWKLSHKYGKLIVKDPSLPITRSAAVFWERTENDPTAERTDAEAEIVVSVCRNLLSQSVQFTVGWNEEATGRCVFQQIRDMDDLIGLLPRLFTAKPAKGASGASLLLQELPAGSCSHLVYVAAERKAETDELANIGRLTTLICGETFNETDYAAQLSELEL